MYDVPTVFAGIILILGSLEIPFSEHSIGRLVFRHSIIVSATYIVLGFSCTWASGTFVQPLLCTSNRRLSVVLVGPTVSLHDPSQTFLGAVGHLSALWPMLGLGSDREPRILAIVGCSCLPVLLIVGCMVQKYRKDLFFETCARKSSAVDTAEMSHPPLPRVFPVSQWKYAGEPVGEESRVADESAMMESKNQAPTLWTRQP